MKRKEYAEWLRDLDSRVIMNLEGHEVFAEIAAILEATCAGCGWWNENGPGISSNIHCGICEHSQPDIHNVADSVTGPDFGCIHHKPREGGG